MLQQRTYYHGSCYFCWLGSLPAILFFVVVNSEAIKVSIVHSDWRKPRRRHAMGDKLALAIIRPEIGVALLSNHIESR